MNRGSILFCATDGLCSCLTSLSSMSRWSSLMHVSSFETEYRMLQRDNVRPHTLPSLPPLPLYLPSLPPHPSPLFPHNYVFTITTQVIVLACTSVICVVRSSPVTIMMVWALCTHKTVLCGGGWSVTVAGSHVCVENDSVETIALSRPPDNGT